VICLLALLAAAPELRVEVDPSVGAEWRQAAETACAEVDRALEAEAAPLVFRSVRLQQAASFEELLRQGGRSRFEVAAYRERTIWLAPPEILGKTFDVAAILRHECAHAGLRARAVPALPILVEEAAVMMLAGQTGRLPPGSPILAGELSEVERRARQPADRAALETALARAHATFGAALLKARQERRLLAFLREVAGEKAYLSRFR
jgi:hypothetical protein